MKKTIMTGIVGMILVSFASAGLVDFLSNEISGDISIKGPIFYTAPSEKLMMNEEPDTSSSKTIKGIDSLNFIMDKDLEGISFYRPKMNLVVDLEIDNYTTSRGIELEFGYIKENGNSVKICNTQYIGIIEDGVVEATCDGVTSATNVQYFYYTIRGMAGNDIKYKIKTKDSYAEVIGVLQ